MFVACVAPVAVKPPKHHPSRSRYCWRNWTFQICRPLGGNIQEDTRGILESYSWLGHFLGVTNPSGQWSMSVLIFTVTIWPFNEWFWMIVNDLWMNYFTVTIVTAVFVNDFSCYVLLMTAIQCGVKFYISADRLHPSWEHITAIGFMPYNLLRVLWFDCPDFVDLMLFIRCFLWDVVFQIPSGNFSHSYWKWPSRNSWFTHS